MSVMYKLLTGKYDTQAFPNLATATPSNN